MKGILGVIFIAVMILIVFGMVLPVMVFFFQTGEKSSSILERDVYVLGNALDYGHEVGETALAYSVYQGCYDHFQEAGVWYDNGPVSLETLTDDLEEEIETVMAAYTLAPYNFLFSIPVTLPSDYEIVIAQSSDGLIVKALSDQFIQLSREEEGETISLSMDSTLDSVIGTSCYDIISVGRAKAQVIGEALQVLVGEEINKWEKGPFSVQLVGDLTASLQSARAMGSAVFQDVYGFPVEVAEGQIAQAIAEGRPVPTDSGAFEVSSKNSELSVTIEPQCTASLEVDSEGAVSTVVDCQAFVYHVMVQEAVNVLETREEFFVPVDTGSAVELAPLDLEFGVRVGVALDKEYEQPQDVAGEYTLIIEWSAPGVFSSSHPLTINQNLNSLSGTIGDGLFSGTLDGSSIMIDNGAIDLGSLGLAFVQIAGVWNFGEITGTIIGTLDGEDAQGTFIAKPQVMF